MKYTSELQRPGKLIAATDKGKKIYTNIKGEKHLYIVKGNGEYKEVY